MMVKNFLNSLNINVLPKWLLFHLMFMSFVLGAFSALFFVAAVSGILVKHFVVYYPQMIAVSGILGLLLFNIYTLLFKTTLPSRAFLITCLFFAFFIFLAEFVPRVWFRSSASVILMVSWLPVTSSIEQLFYKVTGNIPVVKDHQGLKRFLEAGIIMGNVLTGAAITLLAIYHISIPFTVVSLSLLALLMVDYYFVLRHAGCGETVKKDDSIDSPITLISEIPIKRIVLTVILFTFFSLFTLLFIDYTFLSALDSMFTTRFHYMQFLGFFLATTMMVNFFFKLFVYQNLIKTFRISKALQISPYLMILIVLVANILMMKLPSDFSNPYSIVFLSILLSRFFMYILRESFEFYSIRLILSAIETYTGRIVSVFVNLLLNFWGYVLAGLLLLLINSFDFTSFRFILAVTAGFTVMWLIVSVSLSKSYIVTLSNIIKKLASEYNLNRQEKGKSYKERLLVTTNISGMRYLLNYQRNYQPYHFQKTLNLIPGHLQSKLGINGDLPAENKPFYDFAEEQSSQLLYSFDSDESTMLNRVEQLAISAKLKDRIRAVKMISSLHNSAYLGILKMLLRDPDDEVKRNAISCVANNYNTDLISELLVFLEQEDFSDLAADVLSAIGNDSLEFLIALFQKSDVTTRTQNRIIRTIGNISTEKAYRFLFDTLAYPNKWIVQEVASSLIKEKYKWKAGNVDLIYRAIHNTIGVLAWLLAMDISFENLDRFSPVKRAIDEEYQVTLDLLFELLQLKYNEGVIHQVKKHLISDSLNEQRELSVEMLDFIVDEDIKKSLYPLLHNNRKKEKVLQFQNIYPVAPRTSLEALREIVSSDLSYVSLWTKACALNALIELNDVSASDDIRAQVFNAEPLLSELAFLGIHKWNPEIAMELFQRLPNLMKKRFKAILEKGDNYHYQTLFSKVLCLQNVSFFENLKGHHLIPFAEILNERYLKPGGTAYIHCTEEEVLPVFMVPFGEVSLVDMHKRRYKINSHYLYGLGVYTGGITLNAFTDAVVYLARPEQVGLLVLSHEELSDALHKYIQNSNFY